jgi:hypothetical protein
MRASGPAFPALRAYCRFSKTEPAMQYIHHIGPLTALIAGILILVMPKLLNYIIALYLIITGLVGIFG